MHCAFTLTHYEECISLAKSKGYTIKRVCDYNNDKKVILLRHDIDFSLEYAYELAGIEYDLGVCSSYYVYLHSELYNALSPKSMEMIKAIKGMGHEIGLHYDSRYDLGSAENESLEMIMFDGEHDNLIDSFTQHNPSMTKPYNRGKFYLNNKMALTDPNNLPIKYISDSGRNWREGCFCKWIGKQDKLHVLCHPIWWVGNGNSRAEIIHNMILDTKKNIDRVHGDIKQMLVDYDKELKL